MSDVIRLLPDSVANQIAAGEVIQRPSSVIKELVENAIDAGATAIDVWVTNAGRSMIQVTDNGKGMSETDARLAFERHATSKIKDATDLFNLHTMGFRGEALASIAAVSQVVLRTRMKDSDMGSEVRIEGSQVTGQEPVVCPPGTTIQVNNLFYNIPVRRKFLKSDTTELNHIITEFERIVVVYPQISFVLKHNDSIIFNLDVSGLKERIAAVFGRKIDKELLPLQVQTSLVELNGFIANPTGVRKKGAHTYFFVNGRFMKHPYFHKAVLTAYEQLIQPGETPSYFIRFTVDPSRIDVNIHPTKTEIKFEDERAIWQILQAAAKESLGKYNCVPTLDFDSENHFEIPVFDKTRLGNTPITEAVSADPDYNPFRVQGKRSDVSDRPRSGFDFDWFPTTSDTDSQDGKMSGDLIDAMTSDKGNNPPLSYEPESDTAAYFQLKGRYICTSVKSGLLIVDQHRAQVRILFEKYESQFKENRGISQQLLFPESIYLNARQRSIVCSQEKLLSRLGLSYRMVSEDSMEVTGVPFGIEGVNVAELILNTIENSLEGIEVETSEIYTRIALTLAKKTAITRGTVLSQAEMAHIVEHLFMCRTPRYTPDGKTILTIIDEDTINSLFL